MEVAATPAAIERRPLTVTERNWLVALAIVVGSVLLFAAIQAAEVRWGHAAKEEAFVWNRVETPMRTG